MSELNVSMRLGNSADCWSWWCKHTATLRQNLCQPCVLGIQLQIRYVQELRLLFFGISKRKQKGRFCKRMVLANVPSLRLFWYCHSIPVPLFWFFGSVVPFLYPRSGLWCRRSVSCAPRSGFGGPGNIREKHPFGNHPFLQTRNSRNSLITTLLSLRVMLPRAHNILRDPTIGAEKPWVFCGGLQ